MKLRSGEGMALAATLAAGVFLRAYRFHDWLHFGSDQSRDAVIASGAASGNIPWPLLGPEAAHTGFHLGPAYYYFQIVSAKLFGRAPEVFAYPDLLFSVLSIPLLYVLLARFVRRPIALSLTFVYAVSSYSVYYSRFAWNTNPIPFFSMLFILSLSEILHFGGRSRWMWVILLGISVGIGVQLHTMLLTLFPIVTIMTAAVGLRYDFRAWNRWLAVLAIALCLNGPQIVDGFATGFANTRQFLSVSSDKSGSGASRLVRNLENAVLCHAEANAVMLSAVGENDKCSYISLWKHPSVSMARLGRRQFVTRSLGYVLSMAFSVAGYWSLARQFRNESDRRKKILLGIVLLYVVLTFVLSVPVLFDAPLRYFLHTIFVPFLFVALMIERYGTSARGHLISATLGIAAVLVTTNLYALGSQASHLAGMTRGDDGFAVLDQVESLVQFAVSSSSGNEGYLLGRHTYFSAYASPLAYVASLRGYVLRRAESIDDVPTGADVFYLWRPTPPDTEKRFDGRAVERSVTIGNLEFYMVRK